MAKLFTGENVVVGVDEIEDLKKQANELYKQGMFGQSVIGEASTGNLSLRTSFAASQRFNCASPARETCIPGCKRQLPASQKSGDGAGL